MTKQNKAYSYALAAVLFWSTSASAFKITLRSVDYISLLFYSSLVSMLVLLGVMLSRGNLRALGRVLCAGEETADATAESEETAPAASYCGRRVLNPIFRSVIGGLLNPFLYYMILFKAYSLLPAQEALPLNYTWPVVIALLAVPLLGDKITARSIVALLISFAGVVVIGSRGEVWRLRFANPLGDALAVGSAFVWAVFWLMNVKDKREPVVKLFLNFIFGFVFLTATIIILSRTGWSISHGQPAGTASGASVSLAFPPRIEWQGFLGCAYIGFFEMGFTFVLWLKALGLTETTAKVSNLIFLSPFVSLIFIRFVVGEAILPSSIVGLCLVIGGVLLQRHAVK
jgi:drug/metabolite transporter (DMT)-like permease